MKGLLLILLIASSRLISAKDIVVVNPENYEWSSEKEFSAAKEKALERAKRKIASNQEVTDDLMSKELKGFRQKYLEAKTPEEFEKLLRELDANYSTYPQDLKYFAALVVPMHALRAFTYKMYPLVTKEKLSHTVILTNVLNFASMMKIHLPTDQWMAGFKYMTEPMMIEDDANRFYSTEDVQNFLGRVMYPELLKAAIRIKNLNFENKIIWDNKLLYGTASFQDGFKRFKTIGEAERVATLSSIHYALADIARLQAYDVSTFMSFAKDIANLYGYDSFLSSVDGVTARKVKDVLLKVKYKSLFTLRANGQKNMTVAYQHLKEGSRQAVIAWQELKERSATDSDLFNPNYFDGFTNRIDRACENEEKLLSGKTLVRSDITGEVVAVNFPSLYLNAPADLKTMAPISFEVGEKTLLKKINGSDGKSKTVEVRNYFYGRSISWDLGAYSEIFPEIKKGEDVSKAIRIINQANGAVHAAAHLNPFFF